MMCTIRRGWSTAGKMALSAALVNASGAASEIVGSSELSRGVVSGLRDALKPAVDIALAVVVVYIAFRLSKFLVNLIRGRRIRQTLDNTSRIIEKLEVIERKIDRLAKRRKQR